MMLAATFSANKVSSRVHGNPLTDKLLIYNAGRQQCLRYRECSGIASATAVLLASPIGDESMQRPLPRLSSTQLPLPRIITGHKANTDLIVIAVIVSTNPPDLGSLVGPLCSHSPLFWVPVRGSSVHGNDEFVGAINKFLWLLTDHTGNLCERVITPPPPWRFRDLPTVGRVYQLAQFTQDTHRKGIVLKGQYSVCDDFTRYRGYQRVVVYS